MKKLLFTLFYFPVLIGYSQTVSYKIINDNPLDVSKLEVSANVTMGGYGPIFGDGEKDNDITFGVNLRASYFPIMGKIGAEITSQNSLGLLNSGAFSKFNLVGTYALLSKKSNHKKPFILSQSTSIKHMGSTMTTTTNSIDLDRVSQTNIELRGGYINAKGVAKVPITTNATTKNRSFSYVGNGLSVGVQLRNFYHQEVKVDGGYYENSGTWTVYADGHIMGSPTYTLKSNSTNDIPTSQEIEDGIEDGDTETNIGGVVGFRYILTRSRFFTYNFGSEVSLMAPYNVIGFDMSMGVTFNFL